MQFKRFILIFLSLITVNSFAGEEDLYDFLWLDPDKSVYVLQNKLHPKDNSFYVDLGYMMNMTSTFQETNGAQIKLGYFLNEDWAIEFSHLKYSNADNSTLKSVESVAGLAPFIRRPLSSSTIFAVWSPFYGKINTFNQIYYFDWSFGVGTGAYKMESNLETAELKTENRFEDENYTPIQLKTTFKFHINKSLNIGLELLNTNFEAGTPKNPKSKSWDQNNELIFSIGASF
jgi:outer membrane beta-barrel protein